ncbi:MAG: MFS transporter [Bifidobacterium crudilactis]|jgi:predicted MFS family arabinose efflux permease|nr:MFS transporter [Bifidobacterium crudilactis]
MKKLVTLSFLVMFLIGTDTFLVSPLIPMLSSKMSFPLSHGGWLVSAYAIGYCIAALVAGPVSDGLNRRSVLICGVLLFSLSTAACALATTFWMLLALRFITGLCAAIGSPQIWAIIPQVTPKEHIATVMSAPTAGLTIATMLGVPIGSFLSTNGIGMPFIVVGGTSLLVTLALVLMFPRIPANTPITTPNTPQDDGRASAKTARDTMYPTPALSASAGAHTKASREIPLAARLLQSYRQLFANPKACPFFLAYFVFQIGNFAVMTFVSSWFSRSFGLDQSQIGVALLVIGVGNCTGAFGGPLLTSRYSHGRLLHWSFVVYLLVYAFVAFSPNIAVACGMLCVSYLISGAVFPLFIERLQSLTATQRGTVSTLTNVTMYAGSTLAGFVGGPLLVLLPGFWGIACLAFIAMALSLLLWRKAGALLH